MIAPRPLPVELLVSDNARRVVTPAADDLDELLSDPLVERRAMRRSEKHTARVLDILDSLPPTTGERRSA